MTNPLTGKKTFFLDKVVPFGASCSCALFQTFCDSLFHIVESTWTGPGKFRCVNYLDDFLILHDEEEICNAMVRHFLDICNRINLPVSMEKTEWAQNKIVFLGMILDGVQHRIMIPEDKRVKSINAISFAADHRKMTVKQIQCLTGLLNFLNKAIIPGRVFTRRMYAKAHTTNSMGQELKHYHHVTLDSEFKDDCRM